MVPIPVIMVMMVVVALMVTAMPPLAYLLNHSRGGLGMGAAGIAEAGFVVKASAAKDPAVMTVTVRSARCLNS
jgi:hypothetical protein